MEKNMYMGENKQSWQRKQHLRWEIRKRIAMQNLVAESQVAVNAMLQAKYVYAVS